MAENYVLITDSACDIAPEKLREWQVELIRMPFLFTDTGKEQLDHDLPSADFYAAMRSGRVAKTSGVNEDTFVRAFTTILESGNDILYLAFSSGGPDDPGDRFPGGFGRRGTFRLPGGEEQGGRHDAGGKRGRA